MDELREAVNALAEEVRRIEKTVASGGDVPSKDLLARLQRGVDRIQQSLNRLQVAMDVWSEETEGV